VIELVENLARRELNEEEEADAFITLVRDQGYEVAQVAAQVGRSSAYVSKRIRLFEDAELRQAVVAGQVAITKAEELLIVDDPADRSHLLRRVREEEWDFTRLRAELRKLLQPKSDDATKRFTAGQIARSEFTGQLDDDSHANQPPRFRFEIEDGTETLPPALRPVIDRPNNLTRRIESLTRTLSDSKLEKRLAELSTTLGQLKPWQLTPDDDRMLGELFLVLKDDSVIDAVDALTRVLFRLAQAPRQRRLVLPSIADAEAQARKRSKGSADRKR
jgi:hypothetical protein